MVKTKKSQSETNILRVSKRNIFGKKLKKLRKEGMIPANIYGPNFKSTAIVVGAKDFLKTYKITKKTGIIYLKYEKEEIPVLIKNIQRHPIEDIILHIDFRKIDLKQKIQTEVPIKIIGKSEAVVQKGGVLLTQSSKLLIEALPQDIPQSIEIDISSLKEIGQEIKVSDLPKSSKYEIKDGPEKVIISIIAHKEEKITPETTAAPPPEVITEAKPEEEAPPVAKKPSETPSEKTEKKE